MSKVDDSYFNELLADALKSFWDERGLGARYRCTLMGVERFRKHCPDVVGKDLSVAEAFYKVKEYLSKSGVLDDAEYTEQHDFADVVKMRVTRCIHWQMEESLARYGIERVCPCANVLMFALEQGGRFTTELAQLERNNEICTMSIVCFGPRDNK